MAGWARYAYAILRGGAEALPLEAAARAQVLEALEEARPGIEADLDQCFHSRVGLQEPTSDLPEREGLELQRLAATTAATLDPGRLQGLTASAQALAGLASGRRSQPAAALGLELLGLLVAHPNLSGLVRDIAGSGSRHRTPDWDTGSFQHTGLGHKVGNLKIPTAVELPAADGEEYLATNVEGIQPLSPDEPQEETGRSGLLMLGTGVVVGLLVLVLVGGFALAAWLDLGGLQGQLPRGLRTVLDSQPPEISLEAPEDGLEAEGPEVRVVGVVRDRTLASLTIDGRSVDLEPDVQELQLDETVVLPDLEPRELEIVARDAVGNETRVTRRVQWVDRQDPQLTVETPVDLHVTLRRAVVVEGTVQDATLRELTVGGVVIPLQREGDRQRFKTTIELQHGPNLIAIVARDRSGNEAREVRQVVRERAELAELVPADGLVTRTRRIVVRGRFTRPVEGELTIGSGGPTPIRKGSFRSEPVALQEGLNTLSLALKLAGVPAERRTLRVRLDTTPPAIEVDPRIGLVELERNGTKVFRLSLRGQVRDASAVVVKVAGVDVSVEPSGRFAVQLDLPPGNHRIEVVARDEAGNESRLVPKLNQPAPKPSPTIEALLQRAKQNDPQALFALGQAWEAGQGVARPSAVEAAKWYQKAAELNHAEASFRLGRLYVKGLLDLPKSNEDAAIWLRHAAILKHPIAMNDLGVLHLNGWGVKKDPHGARFWFRSSGDAGFAQGYFNLGDMYQQGMGVKKNLDKALTWYRKAAALGSEQAKAKVAELERRSGGD